MQPRRHGLRQLPLDGDRLLSAPRHELDVTAVHERRGAPAGALLLGPHEQVDGDAARGVVLDVLAVRARLARAVLALPLELGRTAEVILVLEVLAMAGLVQRDQQADVARPLDEADVPDCGRELEPEQGRDLFPRICAPQLKFAGPLAERAQVPVGATLLERDRVPGPRGAGVGTEPASEDSRKIVVALF